MQISAKEVAELRRRTNAGLMDSKKALVESSGDMDKAIQLLKEWGIAKAAKKGDRGANEGRLVSVITPEKGLLVEVNCETDFVANNTDFSIFAKEVSESIAKAGITDVKAVPQDIQDQVSLGIAKFGENIILGSIQTILAKGIYGSYIHNNGKIGTVVHLVGDINSNDADIMALANDLAVHITASTVVGVDVASVDARILEEKRAEFLKEMEGQNKPQAIMDKIVEGKMQKFYKEEVLLDQPYFKNEDISVQQHISEIAKSKGIANLKVTQFIKKVIGE